jgi:hypothetical protein
MPSLQPRDREQAAQFIAEPANGAKLEKDRNASSLRQRTKKHKDKQNQKRTALGNITNTLNAAKATKQGRNNIVKALSGQEEVNLSCGGTSKAAKSKQSKTMRNVAEGLADICTGPNSDASTKLDYLGDLKENIEKIMADMEEAAETENVTASDAEWNLENCIRQVFDDWGIPLETTTLQFETNFGGETFQEIRDDLESILPISDVSKVKDLDSSGFVKFLLEEVAKWRHDSDDDVNTPEGSSRHQARVKAVKADLGQGNIDILKATKKRGSDRRPILAMLRTLEKEEDDTRRHRKKAVEEAVGIDISDREWKNIGVHARFPGPYKPVEREETFRACVDKGILAKLLEFLSSPGVLQTFAFGTKVMHLFNESQSVVLAKVDRQRQLIILVREFLESIMSELQALSQQGAAIPESDLRCQKMDQTTPRRCMSGRDHCGSCKFTPKSSVSPSLLRNLMGSLTHGDLKSLSGLDDTKTVCGRENFQKLRDLVKVFYNPEDWAEKVEAINRVELYYQTDYVGHLQRVGSHGCNCLACGFYNSGMYPLCLQYLLSSIFIVFNIYDE